MLYTTNHLQLSNNYSNRNTCIGTMYEQSFCIYFIGFSSVTQLVCPCEPQRCWKKFKPLTLQGPNDGLSISFRYNNLLRILPFVPFCIHFFLKPAKFKSVFRLFQHRKYDQQVHTQICQFIVL